MVEFFANNTSRALLLVNLEFREERTEKRGYLFRNEPLCFGTKHFIVMITIDERCITQHYTYDSYDTQKLGEARLRDASCVRLPGDLYFLIEFPIVLRSM